MKKKELIEQLSMFDDEAEVVIFIRDEGYDAIVRASPDILLDSGHTWNEWQGRYYLKKDNAEHDRTFTSVNVIILASGPTPIQGFHWMGGAWVRREEKIEEDDF